MTTKNGLVVVKWGEMHKQKPFGDWYKKGVNMYHFQSLIASQPKLLEKANRIYACNKREKYKHVGGFSMDPKIYSDQALSILDVLSEEIVLQQNCLRNLNERVERLECLDKKE